MRLLAIVAALLVTGGVVTVAGSAFADSDSSDGDGGILSSLTSSSDDESGSSGEEGSDGSGEDGSNDEGAEDGDDQGDGGENTEARGDDQGDQGQDENGDQQRRNTMQEDVGEIDADNEAPEVEAAEAEDPLKRDQIAPAGPEQYVDITDVDANGGNRGQGGVFSGGSYTVNCGTSDHRNSSNFMAAPGNPNGAQHTHDYVGNTTTDENSDEASLEAGGTSCTNGDRSTFFWPVLRDLNGTDDDANDDGGGKDGNVGRILTPQSADLTFHGTGGQDVEALPQHLEVIMGNAKAAAQDGKNANAKYTCSGFTDRVTDKYPICPSGSNLMRILDYPNCWDGENLSSEDLRSHITFPDENGRCDDGETTLPALRITLTYDQPAGRAFAIDTFPDNQHAPITDHSDFMHFSSVARAQQGADCINNNERCTQ
ncbi:DUF1996 domain-containing protein [Actinomycetospora rhizophila]|uniref:DUF1996 domain-containing protein n=1 Tax=Actinomycetospora rhizophila TaxID=1416876 RepID=A0ABV9Z7Y3_9PSEU